MTEAQAPARLRYRSGARYLFMPVVLAAVLAVLILWIASQDRTLGERRRTNFEYLTQVTWQHIELTVASTVLVLLLAIPIGVALTRRFARHITGPVIAVFNIGQAIPSIGVIALLAIIWAIGFWPVVVALVIYTSLPVLRNTMVGLAQVDASVIESARGMGMTKTKVLATIEIPLAVPVIMAGVRTALSINVGTATLGAFVGAGGLGEVIVAGITQNQQMVAIVGAVLVAILALLIDYLAGIAEDRLRPRGI